MEHMFAALIERQLAAHFVTRAADATHMRLGFSLLLLASAPGNALRVDPVGRRALLAGAASAASFSLHLPARAEETEEERKARVKAKLEAKMARSGVKAEIDTSNVKVLDILPDASNSAELNAAIEQYKNAPSFTERWSTAIDNAKKDTDRDK